VAVSSAGETGEEVALMSDLNIGVTPELARQIYNLVDYDTEWDPEQVREAYTNVIALNEEEGYLVGFYPMPPVPPIYNSQYKPEFMVVLSASILDVLVPVQRMSDAIDDKVEHLVTKSLVAAATGWVIVMVLILVVSKTLTFPLKSMHQVANAIVHNFGGNSEKGIQYATSQQSALVQTCTPDTEVTDVEREFQKMVRKFSGSCSMAKAVQVRFTELANHFSFTEEFQDLYRNRLNDESFPYKYDGSHILTNCTGSKAKANSQQQGALKRRMDRGGTVKTTCQNKDLHRIHFGSILTGSQSHLSPTKRNGNSTFVSESQSKRKRLTSPLFLWIVFWIVSPLLLATVSLSAVVTFYVSDGFTDIIDDGKAEYVDLERFALKAAVKLRAEWIAATTEHSLRDLHVVTRYASWLLFGGLERSDSFTVLTTGASE
jgi:hypothetical protein